MAESVGLQLELHPQVQADDRHKRSEVEIFLPLFDIFLRFRIWRVGSNPDFGHTNCGFNGVD